MGRGCRRASDVLAHEAVAVRTALCLLAQDELDMSTVLPRVWEIEERMIAGAALEDDILLISVRCGGSSIPVGKIYSEHGLEKGSSSNPMPTDDDMLAWAKQHLGM